MTSILPGYEYDIFISYRQKDNKYDGWVTEFVDHLKRELEATFKDEISVYFDANPHNGILETHDVNASLKEKLKCLVFIPILSRTYCDSKSYAWENEFKAFVDQASQDKYGLKVTLSNGNVANRILPVKIHDLDNTDIKLCEIVIGGVLRGIDFIYKSEGVNRPLGSKEDNPHKNLNHTFYRDQINKVALAIKDIIEGIEGSFAFNQVQDKIHKSEDQQKVNDAVNYNLIPEELNISENKKRDEKSKTHSAKRLQLLKRSSFLSAPLLFILIAFLFIFSSGSTLPFSKRDWILITDFENLTGNSVFDKSLYTAFSLSINQSRYINVLPKSRMFETLTRMKIENNTFIDDIKGREIATREGFKIIIVPGISEVGKKFVVTAKILETKSGNILRSEILYTDSRDKILGTLDQLSKKVRRDLGESRFNIAAQDKPLAKVTTSSLEALKLYSLGIDHHLTADFAGAKDYYEQALKIDSGFTAAKASLGNLMIEKFDREKGKAWLKQAVKSIDNLTEREKLGILAFYAANVENNMSKCIEYSKMRIELYPDDPVAHNNLGWYYQNSSQFEEAVKEYKEAVRINPTLILPFSGILWIYLEKLGNADSAVVWSEKMISANPLNVWGYINCGAAWLSLDSLKKAERAFEKAQEINPKLTLNLFRLAHTYRLQGRYNEAITVLKKIPAIDPDDASTFYDLGVNYQSMNNNVEAKISFKQYKKIVSKVYMKKWPDDPENYICMGAVMAHLAEMDSSQLMLQKAIKTDSTLHERFAEVFCLQGNASESLNQLEKAFKTGYRNLFWLKLNPDLQLLRYDTRFRDLIAKYFK